jgi:hypothetical protein
MPSDIGASESDALERARSWGAAPLFWKSSNLSLLTPVQRPTGLALSGANKFPCAFHVRSYGKDTF